MLTYTCDMSSVLQGVISSSSVAFWTPDLRCESKILLPSHLLGFVCLFGLFVFNIVTIHAAEIVMKIYPCLIKWYYCAFSVYMLIPPCLPSSFLRNLFRTPFLVL